MSRVVRVTLEVGLVTLEVVRVTRAVYLMVFGAGDGGSGFYGWCWVQGDCIVRDWY